jgi:hypothetical protein
MGYSSVLQAHIDVHQALQKVSAYTEDMFSPDEIDLQLTRQQERLVEEIITKRFQDLQTGLDYIRPLIIKNHKLKPLVPATSEAIYEPGMVYGVLPGNYYHLVNDRSMTVSSSQNNLCKDLDTYKSSSNLSTYTEKVAVLPFPESTATSAPYYCKTRISINKTSGIEFQTLPSGLDALRSKKSWFSVVSYILENIKFNNIDIYWENYRDIYKAKSFIFVSTDLNVMSAGIEFQTSVSIPQLAGFGVADFTTSEYKYYNSLTIPSAVYKPVPNNLTEADEFYEQNTNVFFKTIAVNPKTQIADGFLLAYEQPSFLISDLYIDYVRKPRQVSLSLDQNFELTGDAPRIVVDRVVETLKLYIENPSYQAVLNSNQLRNQI